MTNHRNDTDVQRRSVLGAVGAAMFGGLALSAATKTALAQEARPLGSAPRNYAPLGARLQGVQHFGLTVQNMERAFAFYTEGRPEATCSAWDDLLIEDTPIAEGLFN